jgi:myo-inositol-1(or 4)-monophosphatase
MPLSPKELQEIEAQAIELARGAGRILMDRFHKPMSVEYKDKEGWKDPVTEADKAAEAYLFEETARRFPAHGFVGEEGGRKESGESGLIWVVDPLDGTTNFSNGLPSFCCSIALVEDGTPIVGAVFMPWPETTEGRVIHARKGGGAWEGEERLQVAPGDKPIAGRVVVRGGFLSGRFRPSKELLKNGGQQRSVGSTASELAMVADGTYQYTLHGTPYSWDVAAGIILVQEAGGTSFSHNKDGWYPLTTFRDASLEGPVTQELLRKWQHPVLSGNPEMVRYVSSGLLPLTLSTRLIRSTKQALKRPRPSSRRP